MKHESTSPRKAPRNEIKENKDLDAMVVIPAYDEGLMILETLYTAVFQAARNKSEEFRHGITVVINNRPDSDAKVKASNFQTYLLLQALEHKFPIKLRGEERANKIIKAIQDTNVPIHVIDAFSDGNSSEKSNVGRARKLGTEFALDKLSDKGFVVSTDADTFLGPHLLSSTKAFFDATDYGAAEFRMQRNLVNTTVEERKANAANALYWDLRLLVEAGSTIENSLVWMSGGGSSFRKIAYQSMGGYREIPGEEDTYIGIDMADKGIRVTSMDDKDADAYVSTRARFSERASTGFGRSILEWSQAKGTFTDIKISSPEYLFFLGKFFEGLETLYKEQYRSWLFAKKTITDDGIKYSESLFLDSGPEKAMREEFLNDPETKITALASASELFDEYIGGELQEEFKDGFLEVFAKFTPSLINNSHHHALFRFSERMFAKKYPECTVDEFLQRIEKRLNEDDAAVLELELAQHLKADPFASPTSFEEFEPLILNVLRETGLDLDNHEIATKVKIAAMVSYLPYRAQIRRSIETFYVKANIKKLAESKSDDPDVKILMQMQLPEEVIFLKLREASLGGVNQAFAHVKNALIWETSDELDQKIMGRFLALVDDYNRFFDKEFKHKIDELRKSSTGTLAALKEVVARFDKEGK